MTILIVGATGTLGRQIVRELLNYGFEVNCLVRNFKKANFLEEWGATLKYVDLKLPETIPNNLKGITTLIDCSTFRSEDEISVLQEVDLLAKISLIKAAKIANIKKILFFSIKENEKYQTVPLLQLKKKIENILKISKISYLVFKLDGFYQGLINQYAVPALEQQSISITEVQNLNYYINTQDIAKIFIKLLTNNFSLLSENNKVIEVNGPKAWNSNMILKLAEEFTGQIPKSEKISGIFLGVIKQLSSLTKWTSQIYDRLTFGEIIINAQDDIDKEKLNFTDLELNLKKQDMTILDSYLEEYFESMLKKLKDLNYDETQILKRKNLIF